MLDFSFEPYRQEMIETLKEFIKSKASKAPASPTCLTGREYLTR